MENNTPTVKGKSLTSLAFISALVGGLILIAAEFWWIKQGADLSGIPSKILYIIGIICLFSISKCKRGSYSILSFAVLSLAPFLFNLNNTVKAILSGYFMNVATVFLEIIALVALIVTLIIGFRKNNFTIAKFVSIAYVVIRAYDMISWTTSNLSSGYLLSALFVFIDGAGALLYSLAALLVILAIIKGDVRESTPAERRGVHILIAAVVMAVMVVSLGVMLASCESDNDNRPNTSDGYVGDNDGDGDIDEKDWEREWKDYLDENMPK